jgi:hypothetical protein
VKVKIQVIIESDDGRVQDVEELACLKRGTLSQEELGLNLAEAKEILQGVQRSMTEHQVGDYTAERINCPCCGQRRVQKGHHPILFRTLFGKLTLNSLRLHHCDCQPTPSKTFSLLPELLPERTAPELLYLEAKWCTLLSFGMTFDLLQEVLPMSEELNVPSLRANLHTVAVRMETELGEASPGCSSRWRLRACRRGRRAQGEMVRGGRRQKHHRSRRRQVPWLRAQL